MLPAREASRPALAAPPCVVQRQGHARRVLADARPLSRHDDRERERIAWAREPHAERGARHPRDEEGDPKDGAELSTRPRSVRGGDLEEGVPLRDEGPHPGDVASMHRLILPTFILAVAASFAA